jgi:hypothetical protein
MTPMTPDQLAAISRAIGHPTTPQGPPTPRLTPRTLTAGRWGAMKAHSFGLLFGSIWALVGGTVVAALAHPAIGLGGPFGSLFLFGPWAGPSSPALFFFVGVAVVCVALVRAERKLWLLRHGVVASGVVVKVNVGVDKTYRQNKRYATKITWRYTDHEGQEREDSLGTFDPALVMTHLLGAPVEVIYNPANPGQSVLPSMMKATFAEPPLAEDQRPKLSPSDTPPPSFGDAVAVAKKAPLVHVPLRSRGGCLGAGGGAQLRAGTLELSPNALVQRDLQGKPSAEVALDKPFATSLSAWLLPAGRAELVVSVVQRGQGAEARPLRFRAEPEQSKLDASIPLQQVEAPYLDEAAFGGVWNALVAHAQLHGENLTGQVKV